MFSCLFRSSISRVKRPEIDSRVRGAGRWWPVLVILPFLSGVAVNPSPVRASGLPQWQVPGGSSSADMPKYRPNEVLVRFRSGTAKASMDAVHSQVAAQVMKTFSRLAGLQLVRIGSETRVEDAIARYKQNPEVLYAEPNYILRALALPNDPRFGELWGLNNTGQSGGTVDADIDAPEAWDLTTGSSDVVVAVMDSGIDYNHQDLAANVFQNTADCNTNFVDDDGNGYIDDCHGIDTVNHDSNPMDDYGHGTHVSGTIGAVGDNSLGVVGINWNVKVLGCKFLDAHGEGDTAGAIECLDYVAMMKDRGVNIVATNNSWGGGPFEQSLLDAIDVQRQKGILFIAAAGNDGMDNDVSPEYPGSYNAPNVISVAATDRYDARPSFSHWGRRSVHLGAPGVAILSTLPGNTYGSHDGTSMATPHVTGVAALLKAQDPGRDWKAIKNLILAGGDDTISLSNTISQKRLNAYGAMTCSNSIVQSRLRPIGNSVTAGLGVPMHLAALNINCASPNGDVQVTADPGGQIVTLLDNGTGTDQEAGDGIYSGQWTPPGLGTYTLTFPGGDVVTVQVLYRYAVTSATYNYRTITGTNLWLGDDDSAGISSPFPMQYGGGSFTNLYVGANGAISFDSGSISALNTTLPTSSVSTLVAPFWGDLYAYPGTDQNVLWEVIGTAPNRELVVEWRDVRHYTCRSDSSATVKFQVVFTEGTSNVLFNYADTTFGGGCTFADQGGSATVGVQVAPTLATQFSYNQPLVADNTALLWQLPPTVTMLPLDLAFGSQPVGTPSAAQVVTLTNNTSSSATINSIATTGDFAQTNICGSSLDAGASCTIDVTFTPTATGTRMGTLTVNDNAPGSPHTVGLSGTGTDFSLSADPTSRTVTPGQATTYTLSVTPAGGFNQAVSLSCTGAPSRATCTFSPTSVTPDGTNAATATVNVTTTAPSSVVPRLRPTLPPTGRHERLLLLFGLLAMLATAVTAARRRVWIGFAATLLLVLLWAACGGGGGGGGNPGTPKGTYTLTLTATSGGVSRTTTVSLTVQ